MAVLHVVPNIEIDLDQLQDIATGTRPERDLLPRPDEVLFPKGNDPEFITKIKDVALQQLANLQIPAEERRLRTPIAPEAIPEIVVVVSTAVILPVVTSILSSAIYDWLKKRLDKEKQKDVPRFSVKIGLANAECDLEAVFTGDANAVIDNLRAFQLRLVENCYLTGSSHVASVILDGIIVENTDRNGFDVKLGYYQERFDKNCRLNVVDEKALVSYTFVGRGVEKFQSGELDEAQVLFEKALSVDEWCIEALYNLSILYAKTGENEKAVRTMNKAIVALRLLPKLGEQSADANAKPLIEKLYIEQNTTNA